ncbi:MAG: hypothetical protein IPH12_13045 [Saprospirales bacterium]|jgi:hypothetical protein|nr:hypothetical protein [Saprospirales bacterium]MBK8921278.1 hypothetical protein [Saprospirales bacterium]
MKKTLVLTACNLLLLLFTLSAQITVPAVPERPAVDYAESVKALLANVQLPCASDPCPCVGGYSRIQVYYFGPNNVTIRVYSNSALTTLLTTFNNVVNGQLLTINGPGGMLAPYTYLSVDDGADVCTTRLYTRCPTEAWPGALDDLAILGKTFRNFTVYTVTDAANNIECAIDNADQDWHVGGNIVGSGKKSLGTRNNEDVLLITNDNVRGIISRAGNFGINTIAPTARLHVNGAAIVEQNLDVNGIGRMNNAAGSNSPATGALVVTGGAGVGQNLFVGNDLHVASNGFVGGNLGVGIAPLTDLHVEGTGIRLSNGAQRLDWSTAASNTMSSTGSSLFVRSPGGNHIFFNTQPGEGKVAIGTTNVPDNLGPTDISFYKLYVRGGILTEELRVRTGWADYVFGEAYRLRPLPEVEQYIRRNGHLPDCPSEKEVAENGLSVGEAAANQQARIEEIFLHLIEMDKKLQALQAENAALKSRIEQLEQH